jgi:hypothetical protein
MEAGDIHPTEHVECMNHSMALGQVSGARWD